MTAAAALFQMVVCKNLPDDLVYDMTKLTWDHLDEFH